MTNKSPSPRPTRISMGNSEPDREQASTSPKPNRMRASDAKVAMERLEDAFGGSDPQQGEILPPKGNGWSLAAWGGFFLFLFFLVAMAADAFFTLRTLATFAPWVSWLGLGLLGLGLLFFGSMILREWFLARALRGRQTERAALDRSLATGDEPAIAKSLKKIEGRLNNRPDLAHANEEYALTQQNAYAATEAIQIYERSVLAELDKRALKAIRTASFSSAWLTTISPFAILDVTISLWRSLKLLREISTLYGGPQSAFSSLRLLRLVFRNLFVAGGLEAGDSLLQNILGGGLAGTISAKLSEGAINGLMTARIGLAAMKVLRPIPFRALPAPTVTQLASDLASDLKTKALGA